MWADGALSSLSSSDSDDSSAVPLPAGAAEADAILGVACEKLSEAASGVKCWSGNMPPPSDAGSVGRCPPAACGTVQLILASCDGTRGSNSIRLDGDGCRPPAAEDCFAAAAGGAVTAALAPAASVSSMGSSSATGSSACISFWCCADFVLRPQARIVLEDTY